MAVAGPRRKTRRGLFALVDGLAITVLAVLLASYLSHGSVPRPGSGLYALFVETFGIWLMTPGVGVLELASYAGIAIAVVGPIWYLLLQPMLAALGVVGSFQAESDTDATEFRFDIGTEHFNTGGMDDTRRPNPLGPRETPRGLTSAQDWVDEVFRANQTLLRPDSDDFLRSPTDGSDRHDASTDDEVESGEAVARMTYVESEHGQPESSDAGRPVAVLNGGEDRTGNPERRDRRSKAGAETPDEPSNEDDDKPDEPTGRLVHEVTTAEHKIDRLSDRIEEALDAETVAPARTEVSSLSREMEHALEGLPGPGLGDAHAIEEGVSSLRESQSRLESIVGTELELR